MSVIPFELLDLSALTAFFVKQLTQAVTNSPMVDKPTITVSGSSPDSVRQATDGGCQLTFYLRNAPVVGPRSMPIPFQPLSLNLYYLLTAYANANAEQEQQAMSIALLWLYTHPLLHNVVLNNVAAPHNQFTVTMQPESADELSRLWQSMTTAARLSAVYRVAVVFMTSEEPKEDAKKVETFNVVVDPAELPFGLDGEVTGTERRVTYRAPTASGPTTFVRSPATVSPGQTFHLWGSHLGLAPSDHLYLLGAGIANDVDVTDWIVANVDAKPPASNPAGSRLTIRLPATVGTPPGDSPVPGVYQLRAGTDGVPPFRSNTTPFCIAPSVTGPLPGSPVFLPPSSPGVFSVTGAGFDNAVTDVLLGTVSLNRRQAGDTLTPGDFLASSASVVDFQTPATLPPGNYPLRIRVNQIEADPAWWVQV
jgi:hypothetical protein